MDDRLAALEPHRYVSLTTYRRDGRAVATPVWFVLDDVPPAGRVLVWTDPLSGKAKRVRATGRAAVAPCDARGKSSGDPLPASGRILPENEHARAMNLLNARYRRLKPFVDAWNAFSHAVRRKKRPDEIFLEITLSDAPPTARP